MKKLVLSVAAAALALGLTLGLAAPASADCNISDLDCYKKGDGICKIKFRNKTAESGSFNIPRKVSVSKAKTIKIKAQKIGGNRAGSNSITIDAGKSSTMNITNKYLDGMQTIYIRSVADKGAYSVSSVFMRCASIRDALINDSECKIGVVKNSGKDALAFKCSNTNYGWTGENTI